MRSSVNFIVAFFGWLLACLTVALLRMAPRVFDGRAKLEKDLVLLLAHFGVAVPFLKRCQICVGTEVTQQINSFRGENSFRGYEEARCTWGWYLWRSVGGNARDQLATGPHLRRRFQNWYVFHIYWRGTNIVAMVPGYCHSQKGQSRKAQLSWCWSEMEGWVCGKWMQSHLTKIEKFGMEPVKTL